MWAYQREWRKRNPEKARAIQNRANTSPKGIERRRRYREENRERIRMKERKRMYGITAEEYNGLLSAQEGVCAICQRPSADGRSLHVDHDHASGHVRGLLCDKCNAGLGLLGDTAEDLYAAWLYLTDSARELVAA